MLRKGEVSVREVTQSVLERIDKTENKIRAFVTIDEKAALKKADETDKLFGSKTELPDLAGIPFALKDNICTRGMRTSCASRMMESFIPPFNATVADKLLNSHAILVGKLNMDELAIGSSGESSIFHHTRNPWNEERVPGGSSGGSAASVAADQVFFALGSDTGGSIRQPASFCGVVGMKPTFGTVSGYGMIPLAASLDQIGPLAKDVTDCAILMNTIAGYDPKYKSSANIEYPDYTAYLKDNVKGLRIGYPRKRLAAALKSEIYQAVEKAVLLFEEMGAIIEEIELPHIEYSMPVYFMISSAEATLNMTINPQSCMGYSRDDIPELEEFVTKSGIQLLGPTVKKRIILGNFALYDESCREYYTKALKVRTLIMQDFEKAFEKCDIVLTPTNGSTAFHYGKMEEDIVKVYEYDTYTVPANLAGLPALSIPCGFDSKGLPIGLQLTGKHFDEGTLLRAAYTYEQNTDHHIKSPVLDI